MLRTISQQLGKHNHRGSYLGVEIEIEGDDVYFPSVPQWERTEDGSLRGSSIEYFLSPPLTKMDTINAIHCLKRELESGGIEPIFTSRTSVHVHLNVLDLTLKEWWNIIFLWGVFEDDMMEFSGEERKHNNFCLSLKDASYSFHVLEEILENNFIPNNPNLRYGAINFPCTGKFGTLEFRSMRGTLDIEVLSTWITTIVAFREYAIGKEPVNLLEEALFNIDKFVEDFLSFCPEARRIINKENCEEKLANAFNFATFHLTEYTWLEMVFCEEPKEDI